MLRRKKLKNLPPLLYVSFLLLLSCDLTAAQNAWVEVRSPHFRVLSDGTESEARGVALQFERIRIAIGAAIPSLRLDSPVPLLVLAPKDETSVKRLLPEMWKRKSVKPGGFFASGSERSFAVVRLDVVRRQSETKSAGDGYGVVYHEYTHSILNANFRWMPLWLNEGLAEFFGNTQFEGDKIYLGAPNIRAEYTRGRPLLPLDKLTNVTLTSPEYRDEERVQVFYSESWGLVHSLLVGPAVTDRRYRTNAERGKRLEQFLTLLENGTDPAQAFRDTIGNFKDVEEQLRRYLENPGLNSLVLENVAKVPETAFTFRRLSVAETNGELGAAQVWLHESVAARQSLADAIKNDSKSGPAFEAMGFLKFHEGKDQEALTYFERAFQADSTRYLSAYYRAMLSDRSNAEQLRAALNRVIALNPDFAPAYVQLAVSYIGEGRLESAVPLAIKAQQLWPSKAGYHLFIGSILHRLGRDNETAAIARYVAERWQGISHDQAVDLWQKLPADTRRGADFKKTILRTDTREVGGKIESIECRNKNQTMIILLDGSRLTLRMTSAQISFGLADTVWYGPDHFDTCLHLKGLRAAIQYRPTSPGSPSGELTQIEIFDDYGL